MVKKIVLASVLIFTIILLILAIVLSRYFPLNDFSQIKLFITQSGALGPFLIILLQTLQVIFVPIPGQITGFISGYFFGPYMGTVYSIIGLSIGSFIAFYLSRTLGQPFVEKIVPKKTLDRFHHISNSRKISIIFIVFLVPMFPDDAICFISGLTKIKIRTLMLTAVLGRIPGCFIANVIGNGMAISKTQTVALFVVVALVFFFFMHRYKDSLENSLNKYILKIAK
ncbi:MAG: TVP38/TMEM64 family protein [Patescibacteria group bacterium]|nr:TVP38/TMEM64 family protein [Patescibacteria group bacterium]